MGRVNSGSRSCIGSSKLGISSIAPDIWKEHRARPACKALHAQLEASDVRCMSIQVWSAPVHFAAGPAPSRVLWFSGWSLDCDLGLWNEKGDYQAHIGQHAYQLALGKQDWRGLCFSPAL